MKRSTEIQIMGTPSTKFTYINHILKQVIERAGISVDYKEITDVKALLKLQIDAIPMVRLNGKAFDFSNGTPTNEKLKELILYLLDNEGFGEWPLVSLITKDRLPNSAYLLSRKLSNSWNAVIDWYSFGEDHSGNTKTVPKERLDSLIRSSTRDWRGQLFSSPLTRHFNTGNHLPSFEQNISLVNSSLIIVDAQVKTPTSFIDQAVYDHQIPVILLNGIDHPFTWKSILLFQDREHDSNYSSILGLLNGNIPTAKDPSLGISYLKVNDSSFDDSLASALKRKESSDTAFAFSFSSKQQLAEVVNNKSIPTRSHPNIFLPTGTSNSNKFTKFLGLDLAPNE